MRYNPDNRFMQWFRGQMRRNPKPLWAVVGMDILLICLALLVFALFHHVIPRNGVKVDTAVNVNRVSSTQATAEPTADPAQTDALSAAAEPTATPVPTPEPEPVGYFGTRFADKFTDGEVIRTATSYQSANVNVTVTSYDENGFQFYVQDIYIKDISCLQAGFAEDTFGFGYSEWPKTMAKRLGAVCAISGDYYGLRQDGLVIRNGILYLDCEFPSRDVCVLYTDGTMKCFPSTIFDGEAQMENGAWQAWNFGPMLLDENGNPKESFNSDVEKTNPRCAIGYYEPGHYCFVVVDGRSEDSSGLNMKNLSLLMYKLGCKVAYNLDGGCTAHMIFNDEIVNVPTAGGRRCSDIILIKDIAA